MQKVTVALVLAALIAPAAADAGSVGKAVGRGVAQGARSSVYRRQLGPKHEFRQPTRLERYTNHARTDKRSGFREHSLWTRPTRGQKGTAEHIQRKFNIPRAVRQRVEIVARPGTIYHERPVKGARGHARGVILHDRTPGGLVKLRERIAASSK